jgi:hypothetical protein
MIYLLTRSRVRVCYNYLPDHTFRPFTISPMPDNRYHVMDSNPCMHAGIRISVVQESTHMDKKRKTQPSTTSENKLGDLDDPTELITFRRNNFVMYMARNIQRALEKEREPPLFWRAMNYMFNALKHTSFERSSCASVCHYITLFVSTAMVFFTSDPEQEHKKVRNELYL